MEYRNPQNINIFPEPNPIWKYARRDLNFAGLVMLALLLGMACIGRVFMTGMVLFGVIPEGYTLSNTEYLLCYSVIYALSMAGPPVLVALCCKRRDNPFSPRCRCSFEITAFSILFGVGGCMAANLINSLVLTFLSQYGVTIPDPPQMMENTPTSLVLGLFVMAVLPALLEEMVFRGYILRRLRAYGDWFAVFVSALLFSLIHGNIRQIPFAFLVGIILGWLYVATNNIWIPITVHFCNNAISTVLEFVSFSSESVADVLSAIFVFGLSALGVVALFFLSVRHTARFWGRPTPDARTTKQRWRGLLRAPFFLLAVAVLVYTMIAGL